MRYMIIFIVSYCSIFCSSCNRYDSSKPTEFFCIDKVDDSTSAYEAFVVYNSPKDSVLLKKMVENYNLRTIPVNLLKQYKGRTRVFFAKSEFLTRDFESGARDTNPRSPHTYQELNSFVDDQIMTIRYARGNDGSYRYSCYYKRKFTEENNVIIHNLDSFYYAKWIETADIDTTMVK